MSDVEASVENLRAKIKEAFSHADPPGEGGIISHDCPECRALRRVFRNEHWHTISPRKLEWAYDKIPLFTPEAFQYYLPAFLLYSLQEPLSDVCQFTVYALALHKENDSWWLGKIKDFTPEQIFVCNQFLQWIRPHPEFAQDSEDIRRALETWWEIKEA